MGVTGLLKQLKEIQKNVSLEKFRGKTVAIDSYAWLHRGVCSCSWELAQDKPTDRYIAYFQRRIKMLEHFGVKPYFVFDGDNFMSKSGTEAERAKSRALNKENGLQCLARGDRKGATSYFTKCVDVTPQMAKAVIEYLKSAGIKYVVAPYEADPQMVFLENIGLVDAIISEDSDLLVFGAKKLLTKLNEFGECIEIDREDFKNCKTVPIGLMNQDQLRILACLSGCDYTNGIPNIGIVKALRLVKRIPNMRRCLNSLRLEGKTQIPKTFELEYEKANLSFQFQRVFNPVNDTITTLYEPSKLDLLNPLFQECIGAFLTPEVHRAIAYGDLDPITKEKLVARDEFKNKNVILNQFSTSKAISESFPREAITKTKSLSSTPMIRKTIKTASIESFFKTNSVHTETKSTTKLQYGFSNDFQTPHLSPTSKRRRLFNTSPKVTTTTSKFFRSNTLPPKLNDEEIESPLISREYSSQQTERVMPKKLEFHSSDFELTDIDDEEDEPLEVKEKIENIPEQIQEKSFDSILVETAERKTLPQDLKNDESKVDTRIRGTTNAEFAENGNDCPSSDKEDNCSMADETIEMETDDHINEEGDKTETKMLLGTSILEFDNSKVGLKTQFVTGLYQKFSLNSETTDKTFGMAESGEMQKVKTVEEQSQDKCVSSLAKDRRKALYPINIVRNRQETKFDSTGKKKMASVKSGGTFRRKDTLDHFIYRG